MCFVLFLFFKNSRSPIIDQIYFYFYIIVTPPENEVSLDISLDIAACGRYRINTLTPARFKLDCSMTAKGENNNFQTTSLYIIETEKNCVLKKYFSVQKPYNSVGHPSVRVSVRYFSDRPPTYTHYTCICTPEYIVNRESGESRTAEVPRRENRGGG